MRNLTFVSEQRLFHADGKFRRMPENVAARVSDGVLSLHTNTSGGRVRFRTDSPYVVIHAKMAEICKAPHMTALRLRTEDDLEKTHERMFLEIREANPTLPIVMMSRPRHCLNEDDARRSRIIEATYRNALARGDRNVYRIDGPTLMSLCGDEGLVDGIHPTDLGFFSMAQALIGVLREIL